MSIVRPAEPVDLPAIAALDARLTGEAKAAYWQSMLERYANGPPDRHFLVAESERGALAGFIVGEVRAWEFGQPAAGWVFAIQVDPKLRLQGHRQRPVRGPGRPLQGAGRDAGAHPGRSPGQPHPVVLPRPGHGGGTVAAARHGAAASAGRSHMTKNPSSRPEPSIARRSGGTFLAEGSSRKVPRLRRPTGGFARDDERLAMCACPALRRLS
jgi:hypothetical protein